MDINKLNPIKEDFIAIEIDQNWYARAIGSLIYAILETRPDIIYAVLVYSRYIANLKKPYIKAVKQIF